MAYDYNKLYGETANALGEPTAEFVSFFQNYEKTSARILDIGCGQGRDALFMARQGHSVVGVDYASNGIKDLNAAAKAEKLNIEGFVADITHYKPEGRFDIVVIDRTLHMVSERSRLTILFNLLDYVLENGWILISDEASNIKTFEQIISNHATNWNVHRPKRAFLFAQRS